MICSIKDDTPAREVDEQPHRISLRLDDVEVVQAYANQFGVEYDKHFETEPLEQTVNNNNGITSRKMEELEAQLTSRLVDDR